MIVVIKKILHAEEGLVLVNLNNMMAGTTIYLSDSDSENNWTEMTRARYEQLLEEYEQNMLNKEGSLSE